MSENKSTGAWAHNLRWTWDHDTRTAFEQENLDAHRGSPFAALSSDALRLPRPLMNALDDGLAAYMEDDSTWCDGEAPALRARPVCYLSMEYGLHESVPIYSGGLGVLAGDHLKSASDLGLPLVAVGLFYREAYFEQQIDKDGQQSAHYPKTPDNGFPKSLVIKDGTPVIVEVETGAGLLKAQAWEVKVGRVRLFLLDTNVEGSSDRDLTARLYSGDRDTRIRQELLLGVGGLRLLRALEIDPSALHLNEGHCGFAPLELARQRAEREGVTPQEALRRVRSQTVFTTHTPVPAGHDRFEPALMNEHCKTLRESLEMSEETLLSFGRVDPSDESETFCMTVLALKLSRTTNGVSALHGEVSRAMWQGLWPERPRDQVPIGHITNGVHLPTWMSPDVASLLDKHLEPGWREAQSDPDTFEGALYISDLELISHRRRARNKLVDFARTWCASDAERRGEPLPVVAAMGNALDPEVLTIGFARRFATYKRANLILRDLELLERLVSESKRPIQILFAGKAHPMDIPGQAMVKEVFQATRKPSLLGKVLFLEDYDMRVGRELVQGVDVWLNNPRRPHEASGTSGQKVVLNAGLNCSILDGWWAEGYDGRNGFAIGGAGTHSDVEVQDARDAAALSAALEEVARVYYDEPEQWWQMVRRSLATMTWRFNTDRMVQDYVLGSYLPAARAELASV